MYRDPLTGPIRAETFLLPEQKLINGNVHARPVGDMFSEHMST